MDYDDYRGDLLLSFVPYIWPDLLCKALEKMYSGSLRHHRHRIYCGMYCKPMASDERMGLFFSSYELDGADLSFIFLFMGTALYPYCLLFRKNSEKFVCLIVYGKPGDPWLSILLFYKYTSIAKELLSFSIHPYALIPKFLSNLS